MFHTDHREKEFKVQPPFMTNAPPRPVPSAPQFEYQTRTPSKKGETFPRRRKQDFWAKAAVIALSLLFLAAWFLWQQKAPPPSIPDGGYGSVNPDIQFDDDAASNVKLNTPVGDLAFVDLDGKPFELKSLRGKNVVLVFTRGYTSFGICLYCATQTSRLITNYEKFAERESEVVVVFPVKQGDNKRQWKEFLDKTKSLLSSEDAQVPFRVLLDPNLAAVDQLGIGEDLSKPATYILDKKGKVRFAHVGTVVNRPSMSALLKQLDAMNR